MFYPPLVQLFGTVCVAGLGVYLALVFGLWLARRLG